MKIAEIKKRALDLDIDPGTLKKPELVRAIQEAEGNRACFTQNDGSCPYGDCCFWDDCIQEFKKNRK
ncbi:MAG: SAP domain-containing protein [Planctomycetota bacterium]